MEWNGVGKRNERVRAKGIGDIHMDHIITAVASMCIGSEVKVSASASSSIYAE